MRKVFWDNPYQSHLETRVVSVDNNRILFEETIAFSFSGGQESDKADINGLIVIHSEIDGNLIYYTLPDGHIWEIEGFSKVACGGTHVKATAEVGLIVLKRINIGGGKERIEIKLLDDNLGLI